MNMGRSKEEQVTLAPFLKPHIFFTLGEKNTPVCAHRYIFLLKCFLSLLNSETMHSVLALRRFTLLMGIVTEVKYILNITSEFERPAKRSVET